MKSVLIDVLVVGVLLLGCESSDEKMGTESHFLLACDDKADCGSDLECVDGVCSIDCDSDEICAARDPDAKCSAPSGGYCEKAEASGADASSASEPVETTSGETTEDGQTDTTTGDAAASSSDTTDMTDLGPTDTTTAETTSGEDTGPADAAVQSDDQSTDSTNDASLGAVDSGTSATGTESNTTAPLDAGVLDAGGSAGGGLNECLDPTPWMVNGEDTGFVECGADRSVFQAGIAFESRVLHRVTTLECPNLLDSESREACSSNGLSEASEPCTTDADCTAKPYGFCSSVPTSHYPQCGCSYGCVSDADCSDGEICECGDPVGQCRAATCTSDADCTGGALCASAPLAAGGCTFSPPGLGYRCQSEADSCLSDEDCSEVGAGLCAFDAESTRSCQQGPSMCP
jgi:hypothetical protein